MKKADQHQAGRLVIRSAILAAAAVLLWLAPASFPPTAGPVAPLTTEPQPPAPVAVLFPLRSLGISWQEPVFANVPGFFVADQFAGDLDYDIPPFVVDLVWNPDPEQDVGDACADHIVNAAGVINAGIRNDRVRISEVLTHEGETLQRPLTGIVVFFAEGIGGHPFGNVHGVTGGDETVLVQDNGNRCRQCGKCDVFHSGGTLLPTFAHVNRKRKKE